MPLNLAPRTEAFPHQLEAVRFIIGRPAVALFDEQGLGKTKIVLDSLLGELEKGTLDGALIVCKHSLVPTWESEITKHTNVSGVVLSGTPGRTGLALMLYSPFYITSYSLIHREAARVRQLLTLRRFAMVLDESHTIKNPSARTTKEILTLAPLAKQRLILTGTPIANYPEDLWTQFYFLDGGQTLGPDFDAFKLYYNLGSGVNRRQVPGSDLAALGTRIRGISIRRTKEGALDLPEKSYETRSVVLKGEQAKMYSQIRDELRLELMQNGKLLRTLEVDNVLERLLRLVQVCSNPALINPGYDGRPAKFSMLDSLISTTVANGEKAVIWSQFVENVKLLSRNYRDSGGAAIHGGVPIEERHRIVQAFQERPEKKLIFAVPAAAREGLTLTSANHAIYLDRGFNLVDYLQSQDRIHRIGQNRECTITKIIATGTVDELVEEILQRKYEIADAVGKGVRLRRDDPEGDRSGIEQVLGEK